MCEVYLCTSCKGTCPDVFAPKLPPVLAGWKARASDFARPFFFTILSD